MLACATLFAGCGPRASRASHCNELPKFDDSVSMGAGGDPNICWYHSYWELGPEDALVIESELTERAR